MGFDEIEQRFDGGADVTNLVGKRLGRQIDPFAAKAPTLAVERWCSENLSKTMVARRLGPRKPRGVAWQGAGAWLMQPQSRQVNFSRTVSTTLKRRGISSSVSVVSSPIFDSRLPSQWSQAVGLR